MKNVFWPAAVVVVSVGILQAQPARWLDVPFVRQPPEGCGAASIAMVMQYWHTFGAGDVGRIQQALFSPAAHGIYASEMERYFAQNGYREFVFHGDEAALQHHIERGRPLIVALKPGSGSRLHYVVVAGVDTANKVVLINDPAQRKLLKVDARSFEQQWKDTGNWTLLAVPGSSAR